MSNYTITPYTLPAFKFCGWCGQQDKMHIYNPENNYTLFNICAHCLNLAVPSIYPGDRWIDTNAKLQPLRNDLCKQLIQLYPEDAPKYMAMILGGKQ